MNQAIIHIAVPILDSLACSACLVDKKGTILAVNHHWIKFAKENYGSAEAVSEGANYLIACETERADDEPAAFGHGLRQVLKGQRLRYQHKYPCHSPNEYRWYRATVQQMEIEHFQGAIVLHENITDEVIKEREVTLMLDISKAIQEADSLTEAIYQTLRLICENSEWPVGEAWLTSESSDGQLFSDIHYLEKETFKPICEAKKGLKFYKGVGFPGKIWETGETLWMTGLPDDENFLRAREAGQLGLKTALGIPIRSPEGHVVVVLVFMKQATQKENRSTIEAFDLVAQQLGFLLHQKKLEDHLRRSESKFRSIVHDQTEMIVRFRPGGIRTFVNDAYCKTFDITLEEAIDTSFYPFLHPSELDSLEERLKHLTPEKPTNRDIYKVTYPDGETGWQEWTDRAYFDDDGHIREYQSVGRDITHTIRTERALKDSEKRFKKFVEASNEGIAVSINGLIVDGNQQLFDLFGCTREETLNRPIVDFVYEKDKEMVQTKVDNENPGPYIARILRRGEDFFYGRVTAAKITYGERRARVASIYDVSPLRKTEQALQQANEELETLKARLKEENIYLRKEINEAYSFGDMVYNSQAFRNVIQEVSKIAAFDTNVLINGETGTGKELIARAIHNMSKRSQNAMIRVNCGALPKDLVESELFGYVKGAFTGAHQSKAGRFRLANEGTLLLDEIGELPLDTQVKLLRVLQEGEFEPLGAEKTEKVDVRVIASTNKVLSEEVKAGNFREDLFFRLNVFPITVPPLRDRKEDIPVLVKHFMEKFSTKYGKQVEKISEDAVDYFTNYEWPGNIRELENIIERAVILTETDKLYVPEVENGTPVALKTEDLRLDTFQRHHIRRVLQSSNWKIEGNDGAAMKLGIHPSTLRDRMKKLNIQKPD